MRHPRQFNRSFRLTLAAIAASCLALPLAAQPAEPADLGDGTAATPDQMKPYYETIPGTEVRILMIPIRGGVVRVGSPEDEEGRVDDAQEGPTFEVRVEPFWIGATEVTWGQFNPYMEQYEIAVERAGAEIPEARDADAVAFPTPHHADCAAVLLQMGLDPDYPAADMTQLNAQQYTKWVSKLSGRFYRLPTEAEWEHAARAGTTTRYSFGDDVDDLGEYAWTFANSGTDDNPDGQYHKVARRKPNPWGLYDVHGNVAEYVIDRQLEGHRERMAAMDQPIDWRQAVAWPTDDEVFMRVVKGGSWYDYEEDARSAARQWSKPEWNDRDPQLPQSIWYHTEAFHVGFRIVRPFGEPPLEEKMRFWEPASDSERRLMFDTGAASKQQRMLVD